MAELKQCKFCGRIGEGVATDGTRSVTTCKYCGVSFSPTAKEDESLRAWLKQWGDEEVNNRRILLIDTLREPDRNTGDFVEHVYRRATAVREKRGDDFLATMCLRMISTEQGKFEGQESGRAGILRDLKDCGKFPQDILGLIRFIRRMEMIWPCYQEGLDDLYAAAEEFGIEVPPEGDHGGETELPRVAEERAVFSQDVPERCRMGDLTTEFVVLDGNVKKIGESAFDGCENIVRAELGESVVEIGGSAFCGCRYLQEITIPASVKKIGACAFRGCGLVRAVFEDPNGWTAVSFGGKEEKISAFDLRDGARAAGMLSKRNADGLSLENCSWYKGR